MLNDVPRIARCAPGAQLLEQGEDGAYVGTISVRLGPVLLNFKGKLIYKEVDEANHRVVAEASGSETKAREPRGDRGVRSCEWLQKAPACLWTPMSNWPVRSPNTGAELR